MTTLNLKVKDHLGNESGPTFYSDIVADILDIQTEANRKQTQIDAEHNSDGTHGDITADSVKVGGVNIGATDAGTATSVGALDITQTGKLWATNVFSTGHTVTYQSGGNDAVADIASNDADSLTLAGGSAAPDAATPYSIYGNGDPTIPQAIANSSAGDAAIMQNLLPANFAEVWSNSQDLYDVTTDATPVVTGANAALVAGGSLVPNGGFDSDTTGWTPSNSTILSAAGGQTGNALELTRVSGADQEATHAVTVEVGKLYELSAWVKSGTSGNEAFQLELSEGAAGDILNGTTSGSWVAYTLRRAATTTSMSISLRKSTATAGTMLFDTVTLNKVNSGIKIGTNGPDGMAKTSTLELFRHQQDATRLKGLYGIKVVKGAASAEYLNLTNIASQLAYYSQFTSETISLGVWVYAEQANNVKAEINDSDGTTASPYATVTTLEWIELARASGGSITSFTPRILFDGAAADVAYVSRAMLAKGSSIGEGNYVPPANRRVLLDKSVFLTGYAGAGTISATTSLNLQALSEGKLPAGMKEVQLEIEAICANAGKVLQVNPAALYGPTFHSQVGALINSAGGPAKVGSDDTIRFTRNDTFTSVGLAINAAEI